MAQKINKDLVTPIIEFINSLDTEEKKVDAIYDLLKQLDAPLRKPLDDAATIMYPDFHLSKALESAIKSEKINYNSDIASLGEATLENKDEEFMETLKERATKFKNKLKALEDLKQEGERLFRGQKLRF